MLQTSKIVNKPWGREEWLELNDSYCYKRIYINAGYKTSLQYHKEKLETNYLISGEAYLYLGTEGESETAFWDSDITKTLIKAGDFITIKPYTIHRIEAITDIVLQEVSTPQVDDCIRLQDDTQRPDGKIDAEHDNTHGVLPILEVDSTSGTLPILGVITTDSTSGTLPILGTTDTPKTD